MDNHSEYLTEKVRYGYSGKDIMRMTSCAVLGILFIWAVITTTNPFEIAEILAAVILLVPTFLLFWKGTMGPVFRNRDSSIAGRISEQLRLSEIPEVSIVSLEKILDMKNLDLTIRRLIRKKYLRNVVLDEGRKEIQLSVISEHMKEKRYRKIYCPNCGADNMVRIGWGGKCQFCGTALSVLNESSENCQV